MELSEYCIEYSCPNHSPTAHAVTYETEPAASPVLHVRVSQTNREITSTNNAYSTSGVYFSMAHVFPAEWNVLRHHTPLTLAGHCGALSMHKLSIKKGKNAISFVLLSFRTGTVTQMGSRPVSRRLRRKQYEKKEI